jgi:hypothetical protein
MKNWFTIHSWLRSRTVFTIHAWLISRTALTIHSWLRSITAFKIHAWLIWGTDLKFIHDSSQELRLQFIHDLGQELCLQSIHESGQELHLQFMHNWSHKTINAKNWTHNPCTLCQPVCCYTPCTLCQPVCCYSPCPTNTTTHTVTLQVLTPHSQACQCLSLEKRNWVHNNGGITRVTMCYIYVGRLQGMWPDGADRANSNCTSYGSRVQNPPSLSPWFWLPPSAATCSHNCTTSSPCTVLSHSKIQLACYHKTSV